MRIPGLSLLLCFCLGLAGCDTTVDPFLETNRFFTLYGTLDMASDTQYVRVIPVRSRLGQATEEPLPISVTSTDLTVGQQHTWRDSVVTFFDGSIGHIYYTPLRVQSGHSYRIEVARGDSVSSAVTTVPTRPTPTVEEPVLSGGLPGGNRSRATGLQEVTWKGLDRQPHRTQILYRFLSIGDGDSSPAGPPFIDVAVPGSPSHDPTSDGWTVTIDLDENRNALDTLTHPGALPLVGVGMRVTVLDEEFRPPGGEFDPDALAQPGTFSNVKNGFGFIGSVGRFSVEWVFSQETAQRLYYVTLEDIYGSREAAHLRQRLQIRAWPQVAPIPAR